MVLRSLDFLNMPDESNYSKRELDFFIKEIRDTLEIQNQMLARIETQVLKTNGRVNKLEFWRNAIGWGFGVIMTVVLFTINYYK